MNRAEFLGMRVWAGQKPLWNLGQRPWFFQSHLQSGWCAVLLRIYLQDGRKYFPSCTTRGQLSPAILYRYSPGRKSLLADIHVLLPKTACIRWLAGVGVRRPVPSSPPGARRKSWARGSVNFSFGIWGGFLSQWGTAAPPHPPSPGKEGTRKQKAGGKRQLAVRHTSRDWKEKFSGASGLGLLQPLIRAPQPDQWCPGAGQERAKSRPPSFSRLGGGGRAPWRSPHSPGVGATWSRRKKSWILGSSPTTHPSRPGPSTREHLVQH